ncbi:MAG: hypothetical protein JNN03_15540 [Rubrivivax sp.]|nr:hypothetical protein [Rubrivivax sp.]
MKCAVISLSLAAALLAAGCGNTVLDGAEIGSGSYLQVLASGRVIVERDFSGTGFRPCTAVAARMIRSAPALKGQVRCAPAPADSPLPYSFVAHVQQNESDEVLPTGPFLTRTATPRLCVQWRDTMSRREKTVITQQSCGA